ncbi:MAG TPA: DUF5675 family protein [Pyrinomonadaceae bacterium]|jgi:hypothetical protein|nr:DUF5675 family protein [Pyrinomonadaceae bacterium]
MELKLTRKIFTNKSTIGELTVDGKPECVTLEDVVRASKIQDETAIDAGRYEVVITFSNKFKKFLPLLLNVKNFEGIRIHSGNAAKDTRGCILVGQTEGADFIGNSRAAFDSLFKKLQVASKKEKIFIEIVEQRSRGMAGSGKRSSSKKRTAKKAGSGKRSAKKSSKSRRAAKKES